PDAVEPRQPLRRSYSHGYSGAKIVTVHEALLARGQESPYEDWLKRWDSNRPDVMERVTTRVECADYFKVRDEALKAHATQIDPDSRWFAVPVELERELWPTEEYELVHSLVDTTLPEDDLFAGIPKETA